MKTLLAISDTHSGDAQALLCPGFVTEQEYTVNQNPVQKHLWKCWEHMISAVKEMGGVDAIFHVGDVVEGEQPKQHASELCLTRLLDQKDNATKLLSLLSDASPNAKWYFIKGTPYHDQNAGESANDVSRHLSGHTAKEVLDIEIEGIICNFAHHIGGASGFYRTTPIDRECQWSALAGKEGKYPKADLVVRAHRHYFVHIEHASKHGVILPCWQAQTPFMVKAGVYRMVPDIGCVFVTINGELKAAGRDPIRIEKLLYPLPTPKVVKF